ncbi:hypothetical protein FBZ33_2179 [Micromonospora sp. A202]|nr:hypothetical protein FBZ33_2179 [Micromonospora sp. A202]
MAPTILECLSAPPEARPVVAFNIEAPDLPALLAARGFFVCRAAGGAATVRGAHVRLR